MTKSTNSKYYNSIFLFSDNIEQEQELRLELSKETPLNVISGIQNLDTDQHISTIVILSNEAKAIHSSPIIFQFAKNENIPLLVITENVNLIQKLQNDEHHNISLIIAPCSHNIIINRIQYLVQHYQDKLKFNAEIEERKRAELALNLIKSRYKIVAQNTRDGVFDWNFKTNKVYYSLQWKHLLGYRSKDISNTPKEWLDLIHPEDLEIFQSMVMRLKNNIHEVVDFKFRINHKIKSYRWYKFHGNQIKDLTGNVIRCTGTISDITDQMETEKNIVHASLHDGLTNLANKEFFLKTLTRFMLQKTRTPERNASILYIDIDEFKKINDHLGHINSDHLLSMVAARLKSGLRADDFIARIAGDEFAILVEFKGNQNEAFNVAQKIQNQFSKPFIIDEQSIFLSISIGICLIETSNEKPDELLRNAELAMNRSKDNGFKQIGLFEPIMRKKATEHYYYENRLRNAIKNNELSLLFQPIIDSETHQMRSVEALLRWQENGKNILPPLHVINMAESTGLIFEIGEWVMKEACRHQKIWAEKHDKNIRVNVNCSPEQFKDENLLHRIKDIFQETNFNPENINIELTESVFIGNEHSSIQLLNTLKDMGATVSIDDFGTGYSSLSYLKRFPVDYLKIDRSFIIDYPNNKANTEITQTIIAMAKNLNLKVVAEGVENTEQLQFLKKAGCQLHQGYYYSKPVTSSQISEYLTAPPPHWVTP